jgi:hypothetical protein
MEQPHRKRVRSFNEPCRAIGENGGENRSGVSIVLARPKWRPTPLFSRKINASQICLHCFHIISPLNY